MDVGFLGKNWQYCQGFVAGAARANWPTTHTVRLGQLSLTPSMTVHCLLSYSIACNINRRSEIVAKLCQAGMPENAIRQAIQPLGLEVEPFDEEQAYRAGLLLGATQRLGLSLGDRACLSLAKAEAPWH